MTRDEFIDRYVRDSGIDPKHRTEDFLPWHLARDMEIMMEQYP